MLHALLVSLAWIAALAAAAIVIARWAFPLPSLKGRRASRPPAAIFPATECILVVSSASSRDSGGRMVGILRASIVLPEPGAPIISTL